MHICRRFLRVQNFLHYVEKEADLFLVSCSMLFLKQLVIIPLRVCFTKCRCKIFCHVGLHLIHLHFYSLEMLYILLVNKERYLSFTLYLLQVLHFYCPFICCLLIFLAS